MHKAKRNVKCTSLRIEASFQPVPNWDNLEDIIYCNFVRIIPSGAIYP